MQHERRARFIQYTVGVPIVGVIYYVLSVAFAAHVQGLADSLVRSVPWYYSIPTFFVYFPFFALAGRYFQFLRPIFTPLEPIFGSADNAALFIIVGLQAVFWGFIAIFCFRFIRRFRARRKSAAST